MLILAITTVLGGLALALLAWMLLASPADKASQQAAAVLPTAAQETPLPSVPTLPVLPPLAACARRAGGPQVASGVRVIDGSTLEGQVEGRPLQFRYAGVRVPENEPLNEQAASRMRALVEGQTVLLLGDAAGKDIIGSDVRYVFYNDRFLNLELVQLGLARADEEGPNQDCMNLFQQGEQQARADRIGVWQATRVPTATFLPMVTLDPAQQPPCNCASRPECSQFTNRSDAQACFNACNDYNSRLDEDHDGLACEELP